MNSLRSSAFSALAVITIGMAMPAAAADDPPAPSLDLLDATGKEAFQSYLAADGNKAFAMAPSGAWGFSAGHYASETARYRALQICQDWADAQCELYAINGQIMVDATTWRDMRGNAMLLTSMPATAEPATAPDPTSGELSPRQAEAFETYRLAAGHKAFATSPQGDWGWSAGHPSAEQARADALIRCEIAGGGCGIYRIDGAP